MAYTVTRTLGKAFVLPFLRSLQSETASSLMRGAGGYQAAIPRDLDWFIYCSLWEGRTLVLKLRL